jgi:hypothetical protein
MGYSPVVAAEEQDIYAQRGLAERGDERGIVGDINAAATGLASGLTLGGSDVLLGEILPDAERERLMSELEAHPYLRAGGEFAGAIAGGLAVPGSGLARTPAGYLGAMASREVEAGLARGGVAGVGKALGAMGAEGALQSAGQYIGHASLADTEVAAEGLAGALGTGFAFGSVGGGAALGVSKGAMAARKLYSRAMGTVDAKAAESTWSLASQEALDADIATAQTAQARLDELRAAKAEAMRYRNEARATARERVPAKAGPDGETAVSQTSSAEAFVGPEPLADVGAQPRGMPTSVFKRPEAIEFNPAAAADFDARIPTLDEGPTPLADVGAQPPGAQTAVFKRPDGVAEAPAAAPSAQKMTWREFNKANMSRLMKSEGGHGPAMKKMAEEWKAYQSAPAPTPAPKGDKTELEKALEATKERVDLGDALADMTPKPREGRKLGPETTTARDVKAIEEMLGADGASLEMRERLQRLLGGQPAAIPKIDPESIAKAIKHQQDLHKVPDFGEAYAFPKKAPFGRLRHQLTKELLGDGQLAKLETDLIDALDEFEAARKDFLDLATENFSFTMPGKRTVPSDFLEKDAGRAISGTDVAKIRAEGKAKAAADVTGVGKRKALEILDNAHEEALLRARESADPREAGQALYDAEELEKLLERISLGPETKGAPRDFLDEVDRGAKVINRYEAASAKLAEVTGDGAHPISVEKSKAYAKANDEAVRKATERSTRAIEDMDEFGPVHKTPKQRLIEADKAVADLGVDVEQAGHTLSKANAKAKAGEKAKKAALRADAKAARAGSAVSKPGAPEALGAVEILGLPGMPSVSDLPVVGPLLGAWLKYRTLKAALGRKMGRVPATADNRVAALASRTRDRIARAVDRSVGAMSRGGKYATRLLPPAAGILANRIYDDGEPSPKKGAPITELTAARVRELAAYVHTPGAIERDVRRELRDVVDPDIIAAAEKHRRAAMEYLLANAPKGPEQGLINTVKWQPSPAQAMSFARRVEAVSDPASVYERLAQQQAMLSLEAAEALRAVYPQLFAQAQQRVMERLAESPKSIPYRQRVQMSLLYKLPFDAALDPDNLKITQSVYERKMAAPPPGAPVPPTPSVAGDTNLTALFQTAADRRAMR